MEPRCPDFLIWGAEHGHSVLWSALGQKELRDFQLRERKQVQTRDSPEVPWCLSCLQALNLCASGPVMEPKMLDARMPE